MRRKQVLCHLMRGKRHVMLKPPGQEAKGGARDKVRMHIKWSRERLISRRQFTHFGRYHFGNILLEQLLKAAYYEVMRDQAKIDNYYAQRLLEK